MLESAQSGPGAIPMLLGNSEVAENLRALISNLRKHGVLFYRDSTEKPEQPSTRKRYFRRP